MNSTYCIKTSREITFKVQGEEVFLEPDSVLVVQFSEEKAEKVKKAFKDTALVIHKLSFIESADEANDSDVLVAALSKTSAAREDFTDAISKKLNSLRLQIITGKDTHTDRSQFIVLKEIAKRTLDGLYPDVSDLRLPDIMATTKKELIV